MKRVNVGAKGVWTSEFQNVLRTLLVLVRYRSGITCTGVIVLRCRATQEEKGNATP